MRKIGFIVLLLVICTFAMTSCSEEKNQLSKDLSDSDSCQHSFDAWSTVLEPTCGADGQEVRVCTSCKYKEQRTLRAEGEHVYVAPGKCKICSATMNKDFIFNLNTDGLSYSFSYNGNDSTVVVPDNYNELPVTQLSDSAFEWCAELKKVQLPNSIERIGNSAFKSCQQLTSVNTPENLSTIGEEAFAGCSSLTSFYIPNSITRIEYYTFSDCGLKSIILPDALTYIGESAFTGCFNFTTLKIPASVTEIGEYAFSACRALSEIKIENNTKLTTISDGVFSTGASLKKIIVGEGVEIIEFDGFGSHPVLTSVTLPSTLKKIGEKAFYNSGNTLNISYNGTSEEWNGIEFGKHWTGSAVNVRLNFLK